MTKRCAKCKEEKDEMDFFRNSDAKDGRSAWCKECHSKRRYGTPSRVCPRCNKMRTKFNESLGLCIYCASHLDPSTTPYSIK